MKKYKRKIQIISVIMAMSMMLLSACGSEGEVTEEVAEVVADTEVVVDDVEIDVAENEEDLGEGEGKEEEPEPEEVEEEIPIVIPYFEENELEFCQDLTISTQAVRANVNDDTDMEVADAEWTLKNISIEDGEDGKQIITIESECSSFYWTDRKDRQMYSIVLPSARYCDLNTGECFPSATKTGDMSLGYLVEVEWDNTTYEIDVTGNSDWNDAGDWVAGENGGYIHPTKVCCTESLVVTNGYNSLGMIIEPTTIADVEDRTDGVQEEAAFIKEVFDDREGTCLFNIMDMYAMLNGDSVESADANAENSKDNTVVADNKSAKGNTTADNNNSKDSTTPKQEQTAHTHNYSSSVTKNPSCSENGVMTYTCACGSSYTEAIPASGHQWTTTTETISHPSTGHYETVTRKEVFCNCGFTCSTHDELMTHKETCPVGTGGVRSWDENTWVVDSESWDEVISVTQCSVCGSRQ